MRRRTKATLAHPAEIEAVIHSNVALSHALDAATLAHLHATTADLVKTKQWEPVRDFALTPEMIITIAANASIPLLGLDPSLYDNVKAVIIRAGPTTTSGVRAGPIGAVIDDEPVSIIGEASPNAGPMLIAWNAALADSLNPNRGHNVVIHEFAHKIDMSDGYTDGTPPLRGAALEHWSAVLADEYERTDGRESDVVLRPYAWTNQAEFFAVASEAFFCIGAALRDAKPDLYNALRSFYRQDPARIA